MKIEKIKFIFPIIVITALGIMPQVYAKTSIEIKPNSSTVYTNKTISEFFDESIAMKNTGEGLEGSTVDVHMATNTDWAIVSYFSNSAYGTRGEGKNTGTTTSINGTSYYSTNGNITGVMDFGKTVTFTSGIISNYADISDTSTPYAAGKSLIDNATNSKYVDLINTVSGNDMARRGWYSSRNYIGSMTALPYSIRTGLFGFHGGQYAYYAHSYVTSQEDTSGAARADVTFRPVIWN